MTPNSLQFSASSDPPDDADNAKSVHLAAVDPVELTGAELARLQSVTLRALRFYESRGLLSPRREGRIRMYSQLDTHRLGLILRAKKLGFTLTEIGEMIDLDEGSGPSRGLKLTAEKCLAQITHLEAQMKTTIEALADLRRIHLALCQKAAERSDPSK